MKKDASKPQAGMLVKVGAIYKKRPQHSGTSYGWILTDLAPDEDAEREPYNAIGLLIEIGCGSVKAVWFPDENFYGELTTSIKGVSRAESMVFAHVDDLQPALGRSYKEND